MNVGVIRIGGSRRVFYFWLPFYLVCTGADECGGLFVFYFIDTGAATIDS